LHLERILEGDCKLRSDLKLPAERRDVLNETLHHLSVMDQRHHHVSMIVNPKETRRIAVLTLCWGGFRGKEDSSSD
jgi:hypothetical protein